MRSTLVGRNQFGGGGPDAQQHEGSLRQGKELDKGRCLILDNTKSNDSGIFDLISSSPSTRSKITPPLTGTKHLCFLELKPPISIRFSRCMLALDLLRMCVINHRDR